MKSKNLKGALFSDSDASILRKGTITIDGELKYVSLIKAKTKQGEDILEVSVSAGRIFLNKPEEKSTPTYTDLSGKINIDGNNVKVTELPVMMWTDKYKEFCEGLLENKKIKNFNIDGKKYSFGGWKNVSKEGIDYIGVEMQNVKEDIPF